MAERKRIGLRDVRVLEPGGIIWDASVPGFGARRQKGDAVSYFLKYRTPEGRQRWHTIGRHGGPWTPDMARDKAVALLGEIVGGSDPAAEKTARRHAASVKELCDLYIEDAEAGRVLTRSKVAKKQSTLSIDKGRIERHIKPLLGDLPVAAVKRDDIDRFLHNVSEGKTAGRTKTGKKRGLARVTGGRTAATRAVGLLGAIFTYAIRRGMCLDNPVRGVSRFADRRRDRRLSEEEYRMLGEGLRRADAVSIWPAAIAAGRFIAFTGWRRGEVLGLLWNEIDLVRRTAVLADTKTGRSIRPLSHAACDVLRNLRRFEDGLVFPATRGKGRMAGFPKLWVRIAKLGALPADVTPHVLRHSFASLAADLGYSEPTIAALVGHKARTITSRYVHAADAVLLAAADAVADRTAELMGEPKVSPTVIPLRRDGTA
jgi:integrase